MGECSYETQRLKRKDTRLAEGNGDRTMATGLRNAVITSFLSKTKDRFNDYHKELSIEERLQLAASIEGVAGVECVYPYEVGEVRSFKSMVVKNNLEIAAINVNVKSEPEFRDGGLTSAEKNVREKAIRFIKEAKDYAIAVGANKVTCCPLADGYEFSFHCDYGQMWKYLVEGFREAGNYRPEMPLFVEYKPSETRGRCFVDTAAKALLLLNDIGLPNMGVTLDFGHSVWGAENPSEAVAMLAESRRDYYVHINDNDGRWDWDFMVATKHYLDYVEFLYYLRRYGYNDFLTSDTSPTRLDIAGTFAANARITRKILHRLDDLDEKKLQELIERRDYLETWKFIESEIYHI
jgi:sugar phosphate isomerase/epimerase